MPFGKRILILAAHPDDEVVASAAAIGRARAQGAEIFALYLTHGCIAEETMWPWARKNYQARIARRRAEAEEAARLLNIIPTGWSPRPARHLWQELDHAYNDIRASIGSYRIDQLWAPAYEGGNADHDALNAAASLFKDQLSTLEFAEYNFAGGTTHSHEFPEANGSEEILSLTPDEIDKKRRALAIYKSEKGNLGYVRTARECWRPIAAYDYSQRPHPGILWYERFQWVPFRHPRVDFTQPEGVSAAIVKFLDRHIT